MDNLIEKTRTEFRTRLTELRPMVDEHNEIERLLNVLDGKDGAQRLGRPAMESGATQRSSNGNRKGEFLKVVEDNPGISTSEAAKIMGLDKPNYLFRLKRQLVDDGKMVDSGRKLYVTDAVPAE